MISTEEAVEEISTEKYEGTVSKIIPKSCIKKVMYSRCTGNFGFLVIWFDYKPISSDGYIESNCSPMPCDIVSHYQG